MNKRRILAWAAIILLGGMYILDLVLALIGSPAAAFWLRISLFATVIIPVLTWMVLVLMRKTGWQEKNLRGEEPGEDRK